MTEARKPSETPYLHVRQTEGALFPFAVEIAGNARALLQLREQIDRELKGGEDWRPLDDTIYRELDGEEYEVVVKRARSREEMEPPRPKPDSSTAERLPWAERAWKSAEK